jgi:hypothetical protein
MVSRSHNHNGIIGKASSNRMFVLKENCVPSIPSHGWDEGVEGLTASARAK